MVKTSTDIQCIKQAAAIWKTVRTSLIAATRPGVSLLALDTMAKQMIEAQGAQCAFFNYHGFPGHICISVNETIIHGVPNEYIIQDGDSITFDVGVKYMEHFCDAAYTVLVGNASLEAQRISAICYDSLMAGIKILKPGVTNHQLAAKIQDHVQAHGYEVIRNFTGHGCGNLLHEEPVISNYRSNESWFKKTTLQSNMIICIEPMIMTGSYEYITDHKNKWSVIAKNKKLTSHWEHMVLITKDGYEILTE